MNEPEFDTGRYSRTVGPVYDDLYGDPNGTTSQTLEVLERLLRKGTNGRFLELGVGTGRLALPLARRGYDVVGMERGAEICDALRAKTDAELMTLVEGDFETADAPGTFSVVVLLFNTIFAPRDRQGLRRVFRNAARHLEPRGVFVVETFVLSDRERMGEWGVKPRQVSADHVELQFSRYDIETNTVARTLVHLTPDGQRMFEVRDTYASPGELDLLADDAGLDLDHRVEDWNGHRFTAASPRHVSVYRARA